MPGRLTPTRRVTAWAAAAVLAFAVPFGVSALRGGDAATAPAARLTPPAIADVPALPLLRHVAALPAPPRAERPRRPRDTARPGPVATTAPAPVATTAPAPVATTAPAPAPVTTTAPGVPAAPQSPRKSFDSTG